MCFGRENKLVVNGNFFVANGNFPEKNRLKEDRIAAKKVFWKEYPLKERTKIDLRKNPKVYLQN